VKEDRIPNSVREPPSAKDLKTQTDPSEASGKRKFIFEFEALLETDFRFGFDKGSSQDFRPPKKKT